MINKIKDTYLAINIYNHSQFFNGIISNLSFETELKVDDLITLSNVHFVIRCTRFDMKQLLKSILDNFSRSTEQEVLVSKGAIRGVIDWGATYKQRAANGFSDPSLFITRQPNKIYDIKENQLLKFLLYEIENKIKGLEKVIDFESDNQWIREIIELRKQINLVLNHSKLREVTLHKSLSYELIKTTQKHKNRNYRKIGELGAIYYNLLIKKDPVFLFNVLKEQLLVPQKDDKIYEYMVLFSVLSILDERRRLIGGTRSISLLRTKNKSIFLYAYSTGQNVKVHYQNVPKEFVEQSRYKEVIAAYGISSKSRIPDIIIEVENPVAESHSLYRAGIIEVKYSEERSYTGEGVQDVQAYLEDYKTLLVKAPKALLATWNSIKYRPSDEPQRDIWITNNDVLSNSLSDFIDLIT